MTLLARLAAPDARCAITSARIEPSCLTPWLLHVVTPIVAGAIIYILWRSPSLVVFAWIDAARMLPMAADLRHVAAPLRSLIPRPILFSAPDALWVYAATSAMVLNWRTARGGVWRSGWIAAAAVLAGGAEFGQAAHLVRGTFDVADVVAVSAAACTAWAMLRD